MIEKIPGHKYHYEKGPSLENHLLRHFFLKGLSKKDFLRDLLLLGNNEAGFRKLWGPCNKRWDSEGFKFYTWYLSFNHCGKKYNLHVHTGRKGTYYEMVYRGDYRAFLKDEETGLAAKDFTKELYESLMKLPKYRSLLKRKKCLLEGE